DAAPAAKGLGCASESDAEARERFFNGRGRTDADRAAIPRPFAIFPSIFPDSEVSEDPVRVLLHNDGGGSDVLRSWRRDPADHHHPDRDRTDLVKMDVETCDHPACSCAVTDGKHFCSSYCETVSGDVEHNDICECGHSQCTD